MHIVNVTPSHSIPRGKLQLKLQLLALNLWQPELLQNKSLASGTLSYILEFLSDPKATCLVIAVVDSASIPTSTLSKKSTLASYHRVREAIAAGYLQFSWKDGKSNPADIVSKHWEFANIWPLLKPLLFSHMISLPRQKGMTEFQPKGGGLFLTLMDQGQTNNPKYSP